MCVQSFVGTLSSYCRVVTSAVCLSNYILLSVLHTLTIVCDINCDFVLFPIIYFYFPFYYFFPSQLWCQIPFVVVKVELYLPHLKNKN